MTFLTLDQFRLQVGATCGVALASYKQEYYGRQASVVEMDGKLEDINDYKNIETYISATAAKVPGELAAELIKVRERTATVCSSLLEHLAAIQHHSIFCFFSVPLPPTLPSLTSLLFFLPSAPRLRSVPTPQALLTDPASSRPSQPSS
jgi:hypothetical protein